MTSTSVWPAPAASSRVRPAFHIPSLDGMRAFSIALVYAGHVSHEDVGGPIPGGYGVTVFFVVSGYLITTLLRREYERDESVSISGFYTRRAFRILPLFYFVLGAVIVGNLFFGMGRGTVDVGATLSQTFHVSNYWSIGQPTRPVLDGTGVYWSLAVEEHFYLGFPLLFALMARRSLSYAKQGWVLVGICVAVLAWRFVLIGPLNAPDVRTYYGSDTRIDSILIGCIVALVANPMLDDVGSTRTLFRRAVVAAVALVATLAIRDPLFRETLRYTIQSAATAVIMMYVVAAPSTWSGRLLNNRVVVWFGQLSYSFYLVHFIVIFEIEKYFGIPVISVLGFVLSVAIAAILQKLIERPGIRLRTNWTRRRTQRGVAGA